MKSNKGFNVFAGIVLLLAIVAGVCCMGYASRNAAGEWFKNSKISSWHWTERAEDEDKQTVGGGEGSEAKQEIFAYTEDGEPLYCGKGYELPSQMTIVASPEEENAQQISLILGREATYKLEFADPSSKWAKDKKVSDYFATTLNYASTGGSSSLAKVVLEFKQEFGEPIILSVTSESGEKTCRIDYLSRIDNNENESKLISLPYFDLDTDKSELEISAILGVGTVVGDIKVNSGTVRLTEQAKEIFGWFLGDYKETMNVVLKDYILPTSFGTNEQLGDGIINLTFEKGNCGMFIENFESFTTAEKQVIYRCWYYAWEYMYKDVFADFNLFLDLNVSYVYAGQEISSFSAKDVGRGTFKGSEEYSKLSERG